MEILAILLLIILIVIVLNQNGNISKKMSEIEAEIYLLRRQLSETKKEKEETKTIITQPKRPLTSEQKYWESGFKVEEEPLKTPVPREEKKIEQVTEPVPVKPVETVTMSEVIIPPSQQQPVQSDQGSFFDRHPDMEKFIGENLISKIGIAVLVLAIGFFVKYAIDQNWIGSAGRVAIGILCGAILTGLAHRFRNIYKGFSSVLAGGGLAVFYFTIYLAYQQFQLFSQPVAFIIMIVITGFAVALSLLYNRQELAIIALIGGFSAPFLVSDGSGNYKVLFTYLIILNAGLVMIAYNKAWRLLNQLCFIFTVLIFGGWVFTLTDNNPLIYRNGFLFATVFYLLFFVINIAHNIKESRRFIGSDFSILLANTALYFSIGIYFLDRMDASTYKGLFSAAMGIFNLAASFLLFRKQRVDINILYLLIGITLTFISITAPIQLHGNNITLFWASEAVLLYWLAGKSGISIIRYGSFIVWVLMMISLAMDWAQLYRNEQVELPVILNKAFITTVFAAIATYLLFILTRKDDTKPASIDVFIPGKNMFRICALLILFAAGALEISYQFQHFYPGAGLQVLYLLLYIVSYVAIITLITQRIKQLNLNWYIVVSLFGICVLYYLLCISKTFSILEEMLQSGKHIDHFLAHWIAALLLGYLLYRLVQLLRTNSAMMKDDFGIVCWVLCIIVVVFLSMEFHLLANAVFYAGNNPLEDIHRVYIKTGLPILWGLCSFVFMWLGMHYKFRPLRIISLTLFSITLLKLFIFDIRNIPAAGKIAAFFCLGVLLLVVSFMYQRLKKIIIDDEEKKY